MRRTPALSLFAALLAATPAAAQAVRGEFVDPRTHGGIGGAHVFLVDAGGNTAASTLTTASGAFLLRAPAAGSYTLRAERIGYETTRSGTLALAAGQTAEVRLEADPTALTLAGITAEAGSRCVVRPGRGVETARVWEEARKALDVTRAAVSERLFRFRVRNWSRESDFNSGQRAEGAVRESEAVTDRPFAAVPLDTIRASGFIQARGDTTIYDAPDADVLLSDAFLDGHCFRIVESDSRDTSVIGLAFEPVREGRMSDVRGTLWLSRAPVELKYLDYQYTRAPVRGPAGVPGGRVEFRQLPNGVWIASRWLVRMPIQENNPITGAIPHAAAARQPSIVREEGGEVVAFDAASGAQAGVTALGTVHGTVFDSTTSLPLAGARVFVSGTGYEALADSAGVFEIHGVRPGMYALSFGSPRLDGLGYLPAPVSVTVAEGASVRQDLSVPSLPRVLASACPADGGGSVGGAVRSGATGDAMPAAVVSLSWRAGAGAAHTAQAVADLAGVYHFCGIPAGATVSLTATSPGAGSTTTQLRLAEARLEQRDLVIGGNGQVLAGRTVVQRNRTSDVQRVMTRAEIEQSGLQTAMDLVQHVRPEWNHMRGPTSLQTSTLRDPNRYGTPQAGTRETTTAPTHSGAQAPAVYQGTSKQFPSLYVDGVRVEYSYGDDLTHVFTETLRRIPAADIDKIEFLSGPQATLRFGTDSPNGAILITTRSH
jgi:hypothetical protein